MRKKFERIESSCGNVSLDNDTNIVNDIADPKQDLDARKHPRPEELLIREAVKYLTKKQKQVWEYHAYDRLTQDEIAQKLGIAQKNVSKHIHAAECRIAKWCKSNMGAYELLKKDYQEAE